MRPFHKLLVCGGLLAASIAPGRMLAQNLTLEGYTGGFITPTAYVVPSANGEVLSHPAFAYHYLNANSVIGDMHVFGIAEGFANRAEISYGRNVHIQGDSKNFSSLWNFNGMNIFAGKVVLWKDGQGKQLAPGVAVGTVVRTDDRFVSGALVQKLGALQHQAVPAKKYTNGDVYIVATKTWLKPPVPLFINVGWRATNGVLMGIGGQSTRFMGRFFGGLGFPLPLGHGWAAVPAAGFSQQPPQIKNLSYSPFLYKYPTGTHIPTTLDYAVRVTQKENSHFTFDVGVGQVASTIGWAPTGLPSPYPPAIPIDLKARHVMGLGMSYRY